MKSSVKQSGGCRRTIKVEVEQDAVACEYGTVLKEYATHAKLPGFRKGKAPADVVEKKYHADILEDTKNRLIPKAYHEAIDKEGVEAVAVIGVDDVSMEKDSALTFTVNVDVPPKFKLPRYKSFSLKGKKIVVEDKDVDTALTQIRENMASYEDAEDRALAKGDMAQIDFTATCEDQPLVDLVPETPALGRAENFWMMLDDAEAIPGLSTGLIGAEIGSECNVTVRFPADFRVKPVAGKTAEYTVSIKAMREKKIPEMTEDFLKKLEVESEAQLREQLRERLAEASAQEEKERLKNEVVRILLDKTNIEVPDSQVQGEARKIVQDVVMQNAQRGMSREQIEEHHEDILKNAVSSSEERVKLGYILDKIADEESVSVDDAELEQRLELMGQRYGMTSEALKTELEKRDELESLKHNVRADKTLEMLLDRAKIKIK